MPVDTKAATDRLMRFLAIEGVTGQEAAIGRELMAALKESFFGSFRNFVPFLVYGIIMTVLAIIAAIPFGLGMLVWVPLAITSTYAAYRAIFTEPAADVPAVTI